ncbi:DsbC family protein [uncultured Thiothrix sp.]|uniref:DsbC family protein n=1 Tax=uncultured Thiothrix sp. TaxID=223185 RepID=UPI00262EA31B|nr:DsbC family protein [uncultured Thiothrix sp.]
MNKKTMLSALLASLLMVGLANAEDKAAVAPAASTETTTVVAPAAPVPAATEAAKAPTDATVDTALLNEKLKPLFGGVPDSIKPTPVTGVYEAKFGTELIYVSADGRYFFSGDLIDGSSRTNLSEQSRTVERKDMLSKVEDKDAVIFKAKGEQKHLLTVFTDVDCGYCIKLHKEVNQLNEAGVSVRYLAYPRAGIGSESYKKIVNVWCADNKQDALTKSKAGETIASKECENPVAKEFELGQKLGVNGTPALFTEDGTMIPGYRPADQLVKILDDMKTKVN